MLYVVQDYTYPQPYNHFELDPGKLGCVALTVPPGGRLVLTMNQLVYDPQNMSQDQSIRAWIAVAKGGNPLPIDTTSWILTRLQRRVINIYDALAGLEPMEDAINVDLPSGAYWLNVLNLVNETNSFFLEISTGA